MAIHALNLRGTMKRFIMASKEWADMHSKQHRKVLKDTPKWFSSTVVKLLEKMISSL